MFSGSFNNTNLLKERDRTESNIISQCRGCLKEEPYMNSLFVKYEEDTTLAEIIEESIGYVVCEEERFSEYLCKECTKIIINFIRFKKTFQEATKYFKNLSITLNPGQNINDFTSEKINVDHKQDIDITKIAMKDRSEFQETEPNSNQCVSENSKNVDNCTVFNKVQTVYSYPKSKETKEIKCKLCDESFRSKFQIRRHERTKHQKKIQGRRKKKQILLKNVEEKFFEESDVSVTNINTPFKEVLTDSNKKKMCKVCKYVFSEDEFEVHFESHKIHICNTCGHRFIRKTDLNDHMETHLDVCKYVCQHCGKAFKVRTALNKHKRIHTNPREEICDVCGQRFNTRDTLKTHYKLKHIKSKDFQCNLCGLAFTLKSTLEKHIERHNPNRQRIYSCDLCSVSYINKYNLSRHHVIKHTAFENRPTCEFCGRGYIKKIDLVKHLKRHHGQSCNQEKIQRRGEK